MARARRLLRPAPAAALALAGACGGGDLLLPEGPGGGTAQPSGSRSALSAEPATIPVRTGTSTITVRVRDAGDDPVEGAVVVLDATGPGNRLEQPSDRTGPDGIAVGTLQSELPGDKVVSATVDGVVEVSRTAVVTVTPAGGPRLELIEGDDQHAPAGAPLPVRPAVRALDEDGGPLAGVEVTFIVTVGGGTVDGANQTTNAEGIARVDGWTLGPGPGTNRLEARAGSLAGSPVIFTAEATELYGGVTRLVFVVPPGDVREGERFPVRVGLADADGEVVPLSGIEIYIALFRVGNEVPSNRLLSGERFRKTEDGVADFELAIGREGRYRLRALTDDLPELGPRGPEPYLFSEVFEVE